MKSKNISNISFMWGSVIFGTIGAGLLESKDYIGGTIFVLLSLAILVVREKMKIN